MAAVGVQENVAEKINTSAAGSVKTPEIVLDRDTVQQSRKAYCAVKRVQDIVLSLIAIIVLSPLLIITVAAIFLDDPKGSPIFTQTRVGINGREFKFYKFRSMCVDAESRLKDLLDKNEKDGPVFKIANDPRVTRVGRFIRKTSIDELPQLFNILKGDMSIVGPRPPLPREVAMYTPYQAQRLYVIPGLSCYWQIQPHRDQVGFDKWVELDIKYIQERSFLTDWKVIFGTVRVVIFGHGE